MKKNKVFVACDSKDIDKVKRIIKETVNKNSISGILLPDKTMLTKKIINKMGIISFRYLPS